MPATQCIGDQHHSIDERIDEADKVIGMHPEGKGGQPQTANMIREGGPAKEVVVGAKQEKAAGQGNE